MQFISVNEHQDSKAEGKIGMCGEDSLPQQYGKVQQTQKQNPSVRGGGVYLLVVGTFYGYITN